MDFCHISPGSYLHELNGRYNTFANYNCHLVLAHLVEESRVYSDFYNPRYTGVYNLTLIDYNDKKLNSRVLGSHGRTDFSPLYRSKQTIILDNSAFEMYQRGLPMFDPSKLLDLAKQIKATYIVMPDYPGENQRETIAAAKSVATLYKQSGFGTFFVPQSEIGDIEGYIEAFAFAAASPLVDYIGVSILGVPNALGVYGNPFQQYLSRKSMMSVLYNRGLLDLARRNNKKIHFLGMLDGPNEILEVSAFRQYIDTWDSSAAVWAGINDIGFDNSPTGLINGKLKSHVDFDLAYEYDKERDGLIRDNIMYIDGLVKSLT